MNENNLKFDFFHIEGFTQDNYLQPFHVSLSSARSNCSLYLYNYGSNKGDRSEGYKRVYQGLGYTLGVTTSVKYSKVDPLNI